MRTGHPGQPPLCSDKGGGADLARSLYRGGQISRIEAEEEIRPYAEAFNAKSRELAKKYGQRPRLFSITSYLR